MKRKIFTLLACALVAASAFGAAKSITIKKTATAPVIDGTLEDAVWGTQTVQPIDQLKGETDGFSAEFKMCYDATNLYVAIKVTDPTPNTGGPSTWNSDCVELFFAMDTNNATAYRAGDWQLRRTHYQEGADTMTDGSSNVTAEVKALIKVNEADGVQEWSLPWAVLKQADTVKFDGKNFRFDVQAAQSNDETVGRKGQAFWNSSADDQWNSVKSQGYIVLEEKLAVSTVTASKASAYLAGSVLKVKGVNGLVSVYDVTGKLVAKSNVFGSAEINLSSLKSGMYIVSGNGLSAKIVK